MTSGLIVVVAAVIAAVLSVRVVGEGQMLAVMRLGQFIGVRGPGMVWVVPLLDKTTRVDLEREIPQWRSLSTEQLTLEIERCLTTRGLGV
jgi:regulator of protease activity HflC (stomatin/prohibitin superfamily)